MGELIFLVSREECGPLLYTTCEPGNNKQTMYSAFVIKTKQKSGSRSNSKTTQEKISK